MNFGRAIKFACSAATGAASASLTIAGLGLAISGRPWMQGLGVVLLVCAVPTGAGAVLLAEQALNNKEQL